jgi:hypothetical protein
MNTLKRSVTVAVLLISMLAGTNVKATTPVYGDSTGTSNGNAYGQNNGNGGYGNGNGNGNNLPINNDILFLLIAGVVIGIKVMVGQAKKAQTQNA